MQRSKEKANSHKDFTKVLIPTKGNFGTTHFGEVQLPLSLPFCATFTILHHIQQHTILPPWLAKAARKGAALLEVTLNNPALQKRNVPPGRMQLTTMLLPPMPLRELPLIPPSTTTQSMERAPSRTPLPPTPPQHRNPTINDNTGRGATSSNGTTDVVCNASNATKGVDGDNEETSNAAINMAASSPTAESSTSTLVDNTVTAASNDNDNNVATVVQVASQMVSILCTIIRWKIILNLKIFIFNKYSHTNLIILSPCMTLTLVSS
jgi:hypothetical protein